MRLMPLVQCQSVGPGKMDTDFITLPKWNGEYIKKAEDEYDRLAQR